MHVYGERERERERERGEGERERKREREGERKREREVCVCVCVCVWMGVCVYCGLVGAGLCVSKRSGNIKSACSVLKANIKFVWIEGWGGGHTCRKDTSCWQEHSSSVTHKKRDLRNKVDWLVLHISAYVCLQAHVKALGVCVFLFVCVDIKYVTEDTVKSTLILTNTHTHTHACTQTRTRTHTHTHAHAHTHTHTHTNGVTYTLVTETQILTCMWLNFPYGPSIEDWKFIPQISETVSSSSAFPSYISGVHHFGWDFCSCHRFSVQPLR